VRNLEQGEEVMLTGPAAASAHNDGFNPYYGLVVKDHGWNVVDADRQELDIWDVTVLWEDGKERTHPRNTLMAWADVPGAPSRRS
jgi:hypothetical protein